MNIIVDDVHSSRKQDLPECYYSDRDRRARRRPIQDLGLGSSTKPSYDGFDPSLQDDLWHLGRLVRSNPDREGLKGLL